MDTAKQPEKLLMMMVAFPAKSVLGRAALSTKGIPGVSCVLWDDQTVSEVLHPQLYHHSSFYRMNIPCLRMMWSPVPGREQHFTEGVREE